MNGLPDPRDKPTLTADEAATLLGISRSSIYASLNAGEIPSISLGRRKIIPTAQILKMLGEADTPPPADSDRLRCSPGEMNFDGRVVRAELIGAKHGLVFFSVDLT